MQAFLDVICSELLPRNNHTESNFTLAVWPTKSATVKLQAFTVCFNEGNSSNSLCMNM